MHLRLGEILMAQGAINEDQLFRALRHQRSFQSPLGRVLIDHGFCQPEAVLKALAIQHGVPTVQIETQRLETSLTSLIPARVAYQYRAVPLAVQGDRADRLIVAMAAPISFEAIGAVRAVSGKRRIEPQLASDEDIEAALKLLYGNAPGAEPFRRVARSVPTRKRAEPVLLYGWNPQASRTLALCLRAHGIPTVEASSHQVETSPRETILISALPVVEQLRTEGKLGNAQTVVAVKDPQRDLPRAQSVGARGYVNTPVSPEILLRAISRLRPHTAPSGPSSEVQALFPLLPRVA